jgi:chromosome partitioning protein
MVVIAFASLKGGVGKTTLTYNLASLWADGGKRVLAIDFDPQGNLTFAFCLPKVSPRMLKPAVSFHGNRLNPFKSPRTSGFWGLTANWQVGT